MYIADSNWKMVPVEFEQPSQEHLFAQLILSAPFAPWWESIDANKLAVDRITIQSVDVFSSGKIGFVKMLVSNTEVATGSRVPGIVFLRGGSVAVLPLLVTTQGTLYTLLCQQMSVAIGTPTLGVPSGMLDGSGNFTGKAAEEVAEETGLHLDHTSLIDLVTLTTDSDDRSDVLVSPGGSEETFRLYTSIQRDVDQRMITDLASRVHGTGNSEHITLLPLELQPGTMAATLLRHTYDAKTYMLGAMVDQALRDGTLTL